MKHAQKELDKNRFLRSINLLTERFFSKKPINLDQLESFAKTGSLEVTLNLVTVGKAYDVMKESIFENQKVLILKLCTDIRNYKLYSLLQNEFVGVECFDDKDNNLFKKFVEKAIIKDGKIYQKKKTGLKIERYPKIYGYGIYEDSDNEPFFMEYIMPALYTLDRDVPDEPKAKIYYTRAGARKFRSIPDQLKEGMIIVVGKKN